MFHIHQVSALPMALVAVSRGADEELDAEGHLCGHFLCAATGAKHIICGGE
jgi:hypothetical protein